MIAGRVPIKPEEAELATNALEALVVATRAEEGCREYTMGLDLADPSLVRIFEVWESDEALASHARSAHVDAWRAIAPRVVAGPLELMRYVIESAGPYP